MALERDPINLNRPVTHEDMIKKCDEIIDSETGKRCDNICKPLPSASNLGSSEFYCDKCHISYRMPVEVARQFLGSEVKRNAQR